MRKLLAVLLVFGSASAALGGDWHDNEVRWRGIAGVIGVQNGDNIIGDPGDAHVDSGTFAWTARAGQARVNLSASTLAFHVEGLVINGTVFSGTPGPVTEVTGTLVCNPGDDTQALIDTPEVPLSARGDAAFSGLIGPIPAACSNPLFLIRIVTPAQALGLWIATGTERSSGDDHRDDHSRWRRSER
jgi:hypothetical protein